MRKPERNPYDSSAPLLFAESPATSEIGIVLRKSDAKARLREMAEVEPTILRQEAINSEIADRIERLHAEHQLNMQYLMQFGVSAAERETFRAILEEVSRHGGLGLREAADLAHARTLAAKNESDIR
jgi:hypothetical protein